ncbi:MAG TPA: beta-L-arabinofuranosidase domain-containing protein [Fimbriimonas sp.]|nr:beta-L-arabinofuranosidase domain-containing protein [Fimbriimonas sp.]
MSALSAPASYKVSPALELVHRPQIKLSGPIAKQIHGVIENWLLPLPERNPAILGMFQDRDKKPLRNLLAWSGEFAGKYLTSGTEVYRLTHDLKLKETLQKFVDGMVARQDPDGYFGPFPKANHLTGWAPNTWGTGGETWDVWGHYHAIVGLLHWFEETGDRKALIMACKIGDLLCRFFADRTIASTGSPEMNQAIVHGFAMLYRKTGERRFLQGAEQVVDEFSSEGAGNYLQGALAGKEFYQMPNAGPRWESLHSIMGLAELYWETGKPEYRRAFEHLYWSIAKTDRHSNGGFSSGEQAHGDPYRPGAIETCCTIAWTAMGVAMLRMTGDSRVADELELSTLNQIVALHAPDGSWCTYNTPMDGVRVPSTEDIAFQIRPGSEGLNCCSVNAARGFGMISDWALMKKGDGLALNWYGPSTFVSHAGGVEVNLLEETRYPQEGHVVVHIEPAKPATFPLYVRIPHWSEQTTVTLNGRRVAAAPGAYLKLERTWKSGDKITLDLDMRPRFWVGQRECLGKASVYRGPILFALDAPGSVPSFSKEWETSGDLRVTKSAGAAMEYKFEGDFVRLHAQLFDDAGVAEVKIDGKPVDTVDLYGPERGKPFQWERKGLGPGRHTLVITASGKKQEVSKNVWINVGKIEPAPAPPRFSAEDFSQATFKSSGDGVGSWEVNDLSGNRLVLRDYGSAGRNRVPYITWFPVEHAPSAPFSQGKPSRTAHLSH